jgi:hypothetical protein
VVGFGDDEPYFLYMIAMIETTCSPSSCNSLWLDLTPCKARSVCRHGTRARTSSSPEWSCIFGSQPRRIPRTCFQNPEASWLWAEGAREILLPCPFSSNFPHSVVANQTRFGRRFVQVVVETRRKCWRGNVDTPPPHVRSMAGCGNLCHEREEEKEDGLGLERKRGLGGAGLFMYEHWPLADSLQTDNLLLPVSSPDVDTLERSSCSRVWSCKSGQVKSPLAHHKGQKRRSM